MNVLSEEYKELLATSFSHEGHRLAIICHHLEEISYLYEQRLGLLCDPELSWRDIADFDSRREAHQDALTVGGDLALAWAVQQAEQGDFGELFGAVSLFCRQDRFDLFTKALESVDPEDPDVLTAVKNALAWELPKSWEQKITALIDEEPWIPAFVYVLGYRRISCTALLEKLFVSPPSGDLGGGVVSPPSGDLGGVASGISPELIRAIGRLNARQLAPKIKQLASQTDDPELLLESSKTLLRFGDRDTPRLIFLHTPSPVYSVFAGNAPSADSPLSHGVFGAFNSVNGLIEQLSDENLGDQAAMALYMITGAELFEDHFVPEEIDEDELFDDEKEKLAKGEPLYAPGEEPGTTIRRFTHNPDRWIRWINDHAEWFERSGRYRLGKPYGKSAVIDSLKSDHFQIALRSIFADELAINFGIQTPFEPDLPVQEQVRILNGQ